jgi:hypothetical protein
MYKELLWGGLFKRIKSVEDLSCIPDIPHFIKKSKYLNKQTTHLLLNDVTPDFSTTLEIDHTGIITTFVV